MRLNGSASFALDLKVLDANHLWTSNNAGEITWTTDGGNRWNLARVDDFTNNNEMRAIDFIDTQNGWVGGGFGSLHQSTDGGRTWVKRDAGTAQQIFGVDVVTPQTIVIVGGGTSFTMARRSTDGGATWQEMQVHIPDTLFLDVFFVNETTGWIVGSSGGISKTTDAGATWTGQPRVGSWGFVSVNFSDPNNGWAGGYFADLYHTTNGGATWTQQNPALPDRTHVLGVSAINANVAWISGYGAGPSSLPYVKHTTNGGVTWVEDTPVVGPTASSHATDPRGQPMSDQAEQKLIIASRLKEARKRAGLTQGQVAAQMGLHRPTISEIEAGNRSVAGEELKAFSCRCTR